MKLTITGTRGGHWTAAFVLILLALAVSVGRAETFTNTKTGEKLIGKWIQDAAQDGKQVMFVRLDDGKERFLPKDEWKRSGATAQSEPPAPPAPANPAEKPAMEKPANAENKTPTLRELEDTFQKKAKTLGLGQTGVTGAQVIQGKMGLLAWMEKEGFPVQGATDGMGSPQDVAALGKNLQVSVALTFVRTLNHEQQIASAKERVQTTQTCVKQEEQRIYVLEHPQRIFRDVPPRRLTADDLAQIKRTKEALAVCKESLVYAQAYLKLVQNNIAIVGNSQDVKKAIVTAWIPVTSKDAVAKLESGQVITLVGAIRKIGTCGTNGPFDPASSPPIILTVELRGCRIAE